MPANNAIGTGAITITANADKMLAGLDQAGKQAAGKAQQIGEATKKAAGKGVGKGGLFGDILGGAIGGLAAGVGKGLFSSVQGLPGKLEGLREKAVGSQQGAIDSVSRGLLRLSQLWDRVLAGIIETFAPAFGSVVDAIYSAFDGLAGPLAQVKAAVEVVAFVAAELFGEFLKLAVEAIQAVSDWAKETLGLGDTTQGVGDQMFAVLRLIGKGFGYVWDTVKAGVGIVATVAGYIVQALGKVVHALGQMVGAMAAAADYLPGFLKPDGLGKAAFEIGKAGYQIDKAGQGMAAWGKNAVMAWGDSEKAVDGWFDQVQRRLAERKKAFERPVFVQQKLAGAFERGSTDAYSIVANYNAGRPDKNQPMREAADQAKAIKTLVELLVKDVRDLTRKVSIIDVAAE